MSPSDSSSSAAVIEPASPDAIAVAGVILAVCFLATGGIFVKLSPLDPIATGAWRILLALPLVYGWDALERRRAPRVVSRLERRDLVVLWAAGALLGLDLTFWNISFHYTTVANANLLANLVPFVVVPLSVLLYRERIRRSFLVGLALTLCGVTLLLSASLQASLASALGDGLALLTAVFYGLYLLLVSRLRRRFGPGRILYLSSLGCLSTLVPLALLLEQRLVPTGLEDLAPLVGLAVLSHVVGQGMLAQCLRPVPVALSSVLVLMQPVVAAIYAWILFHETLTVRQIVGITICLVGLYFAKRGQ
ncbi:DMT family transporter [Magnetospirillum molischianum]|uniref:EamA domain-containing protein n=1 Tax=Magnetospirillum molischianum DSM 120 TaxID=1150626 RepID=H8FRI4_MAGML|nr:DMT family transporter [Magnetospirillum molischianum]CCG40972.1 conserved membrane hypothetical protein [Magnetospirillum molischianum DSM 120]